MRIFPDPNDSVGKAEDNTAHAGHRDGEGACGVCRHSEQGPLSLYQLCCSQMQKAGLRGRFACSRPHINRYPRVLESRALTDSLSYLQHHCLALEAISVPAPVPIAIPCSGVPQLAASPPTWSIITHLPLTS